MKRRLHHNGLEFLAFLQPNVRAVLHLALEQLDGCRGGHCVFGLRMEDVASEKCATPALNVNERLWPI